MLLTGLQRKSESALAVEVGRSPDDAPGHLPDVLLLAGHEAEIGSAGGQRDAEWLALPDGDISPGLAPAAGRRQQGERCRIDDAYQQGILGMGPVRQPVDIFECSQE